MTSILGIYTNHDLSVCLLIDGQIACCIEEERLNRIKHGLTKEVRELWPTFSGRFGYFPWASVRYCLDAAGLGLDDLDAVVCSNPHAASLVPLKDPSRMIVATTPEGGVHHYMHALSAFYASPFDDATVLVVDGSGSKYDGTFEAETGYQFDDRQGTYREIFKNRYPSDVIPRAGLGFTYEYVTAILGFVNRLGYLADAGKTMGLAPYGKPYIDFEQPWFQMDGFHIDFSPFHQWLHKTGMFNRINFASKERGIIQSESQPGQYAADLAFKVQKEVETALLGLTAHLREHTSSRNLCLAGGVHLNSVANGLIAKQGLFDHIFVQPAANDSGQAIGLAYFGQQHLNQTQRSAVTIQPMLHAYGGRTYADDSIRELLEGCQLDYEYIEDSERLYDDAAGTLAQAKIIGWFQGGSEIGPRALGHRSILADPRKAEHKDILNAKVKFREGFRPFAPSVLAERATEVFDMRGDSPFMLMVVPVKEQWRDQVPAISHVDHSARIQTVSKQASPAYHGLISAFARHTGVPLVLNTSFNLRGMPIVETPADALRCFLFTEMDVLYLGPFKVRYPKPEKLIPDLVPGWRLEILRATRHDNWQEASFVAKSGASCKVSPIPGMVDFCSQIDGRTHLNAIAEKAGLEEAFLPLAINFVRILLRQGVLQLRVGNLTFPLPVRI